MKSHWITTGILFSLVTCISAGPLLTNCPATDFLQQGDLDGSIGAAAYYQDFHDSSATNIGLAWGFIEASYTSPSIYGLQFGGGILGITKIWEDQENDYRTTFIEDFDLKGLFLSYDILETSNSLLIGRTLFTRNAGMRGDSYQGLQLSLNSISHISLSASVIERWIHHDTPLFTADGITGWESVNNINDEAGNQFYTAILTSQWMEDNQLVIAPFINYQDNVMTVYGAQLDFTQPLHTNCNITIDCIGSLYVNNVPEDIEPDYEDVTSFLLHASVGNKACNGGLGWFYLSNDKANLNSGVFDDFDPLKEDDLFPYGDENNGDLFYIDSHITSGPFSTDLAFGYGKNKALDAYSRELDIWLYYDICTQIQLSGYFIWTDYDTKEVPDYQLGGISLAYTF